MWTIPKKKHNKYIKTSSPKHINKLQVQMKWTQLVTKVNTFLWLVRYSRNLHASNYAKLMPYDWFQLNARRVIGLRKITTKQIRDGCSNVYKQTDECQWSTDLGYRGYVDLATKIFVYTNECWLRITVTADLPPVIFWGTLSSNAVETFLRTLSRFNKLE